MFFYHPCCERGARGRIFFCKPPAAHRPLFMPPFAGDIGARAGSLKWIAQIPRKACRWALKGNSKKVFWAWMWDIFFCGGTLSCVPTKHEQLEQLHFCLCKKRPRKKKRSSSGVVFIFVDESGGLRPPHPPLSTKNCESHFRQLVFTHERSVKWGYAKQHLRSMVQHFSNSVINNNKQQAKYGPYTLKGGVVK